MREQPDRRATQRATPDRRSVTPPTVVTYVQEFFPFVVVVPSRDGVTEHHLPRATYAGACHTREAYQRLGYAPEVMPHG